MKSRENRKIVKFYFRKEIDLVLTKVFFFKSIKLNYIVLDEKTVVLSSPPSFKKYLDDWNEENRVQMPESERKLRERFNLN